MDEEHPPAFEATERQSWIGQCTLQMQTWQCVRVLVIVWKGKVVYAKMSEAIPVSRNWVNKTNPSWPQGLRTDFRMAQKANGGFCAHSVKVGFGQVEL
jgi:hypothetical protein